MKSHADPIGSIGFLTPKTMAPKTKKPIDFSHTPFEKGAK